MWKMLLGALADFNRPGEDTRRNREGLKELCTAHDDFAASPEEEEFRKHEAAIQRLILEAQHDRENAARDRADAARDRENLLLRLEVEHLRALLTPSAPRPKLPPGA